MEEYDPFNQSRNQTAFGTIMRATKISSAQTISSAGRI